MPNLEGMGADGHPDQNIEGYNRKTELGGDESGKGDQPDGKADFKDNIMAHRLTTSVP
ncbi:hypothetical protein D3C73_1319920 [compost metagenome]